MYKIKEILKNAQKEIYINTDCSFEEIKEDIEKLFVKIMAEHIHNDIYLLKIRDKYGKEIYDDYLRIDTIFERKARGEV